MGLKSLGPKKIILYQQYKVKINSFKPHHIPSDLFLNFVLLTSKIPLIQIKQGQGRTSIDIDAFPPKTFAVE